MLGLWDEFLSFREGYARRLAHAVATTTNFLAVPIPRIARTYAGSRSEVKSRSTSVQARACGLCKMAHSLRSEFSRARVDASTVEGRARLTDEPNLVFSKRHRPRANDRLAVQAFVGITTTSTRFPVNQAGPARGSKWCTGNTFSPCMGESRGGFRTSMPAAVSTLFPTGLAQSRVTGHAV